MLSAGPKYQQALAHIGAARYDEAIAILQSLQKIDPRDATIASALGKCFAETGRNDLALYSVERCLQLNPADRVAAINLLQLLVICGKKKEAAERGRKLMERFGRDPQVVYSYASALVAALRYDEAERLIVEFQTRVGPSPALLSYLGAILLNLGRAPEAEKVLRETLRLMPGEPTTTGLLASTLNYLDGADRRECFEWHRAFGRAVEQGRPLVDPLSFPATPDPERVVRVGLVSPDFREHPVARFVEAILRHHDPARVHLTCFFNFPTDDEVTDELRQLADGWVALRNSRPDELARAVREAGIDVLIELCGLTANSPLFAMAPRLAPVQVSAIGYPHTTGMSVVDYRIVDARTDPEPEADAFATERLLRLDPCFLCYTPRHTRLPSPPPHESSGVVTFGSFNKITKYSDRALALWARVVDRVPGSRLIVKTAALEGESARRHVASRLTAAGLAPDRFELVGLQNKASDHLAMYDRVDVALDTFPYHGTTTTCEALSMGVPVIVLEGDAHASRVGVSLLHAVGVPEFLARSEQEYLEKAIALASDRARLSELRATLRGRLLASALCDGKAYAERFERAIRLMWRSWCERRHART